MSGPSSTRARNTSQNKECLNMKKTYKIEVDCANCANLMEDAAKKTAGVANATVNFMTQKMTVEFEDGQDPKAVMQTVLKNCKKVEDDCEIFL
jgi:copper chaperone CopZ